MTVLHKAKLSCNCMPSNNPPLVSVVVPMYECERYIAKCLESLLKQTFTNFEVICVDDASPNNCLEIARECVAGDGRFSFFELPTNSGQSTARNVALNNARGTYIILLDADDYLVPDALEKIASRMETGGLDDLYFNAKSFYEDKAAFTTLVEDFEGRMPFEGIATGPELFTFFENNNQFFPHGALRAVRRGLIEKNNIRFVEGIIHEDLLFTLQTLIHSKRSSFLSDQIYMRRIHVGSTMATPRKTMRNITGHLVSINWMHQYLLEHAEELDAGFIDAMSHRMNAYLDICAQDYLNDVTDAEKQEYLVSLSPDERIRFNLQVAMRAESWREIYESLNWRIGKAATAFPRALKDGLSFLNSKQ